MSQYNLSPDITGFILALVEQSRDVFWIRTPDYSQQLYISPAYEIVWGRSRESLYQHPERWADAVYPEDLKKLLASLEKRNPRDIQAGKFFTETYRIIRPNGDICWILDKSSPIYDQHGKHIGFAGIAQDITENKRQEEMVLKAKEAAEIASAAKTDFIRNMSHDLRTPLTGIIGMAEIINREPEASMTKTGAQDIHQAGVALLNLLNEILETTRLESGEILQKKTCFALKNTIDALISIFRPAIKHKGLKLEAYYDDNIPKVLYGAEILLHRIILNLLGNAVKFTDRGAISIEVSLLQKRVDKVSLKIVVKDTGLGIPKDKQQMIFDKFSRLTPSYGNHYKGSGLGLYMVKQFIEKLGGDIKVNSESGRGAQFVCTVQFKIPTAVQLAKYHAQGEEKTNRSIIQEYKFNRIDNRPVEVTKGARVLLVEDNELVQKTTAFNLHSWGYGQVDIAGTGQDAIDKMFAQKYDLIYLDLGLPDISGQEVAKQVRKKPQSLNQDTLMVALTAHADKAIEEECKAVGINRVLLKPLLEKYVKVVAQNKLVDWDLWKQRCGGHQDLMQQAFEITMRMLPEFKTKSTTAMQEKNYAELDNVVHKCYGGLKYCGLPLLETATRALESAIRTKQYAELDALHKDFIQQIDAAMTLTFDPK